MSYPEWALLAVVTLQAWRIGSLQARLRNCESTVRMLEKGVGSLVCEGIQADRAFGSIDTRLRSLEGRPQ